MVQIDIPAAGVDRAVPVLGLRKLSALSRLVTVRGTAVPATSIGEATGTFLAAATLSTGSAHGARRVLLGRHRKKVQ